MNAKHSANAPAKRPRRKQTEANTKHQSLDSDHGTPPEIIEPMRKVMGSITLDPCTSHTFNAHLIKAQNLYTAEHNGLRQKLFGNVWINPPGGLCDAYGVMLPRDKDGKQERKLPPDASGKRPARPRSDCLSAPRVWWEYLMKWWVNGSVKQFGFELFSIELLAKLQKVQQPYPKVTDFCVCILKDRVRHLRLDPNTGELVRGAQPTHFSGVVYGGPNVRKFKYHFSKLGATGTLR